MNLIDVLEALAKTPGRNDKVTILREARADPRVQGAFLRTYDWERTYGLRVPVDQDDGTGRPVPLFGQAAKVQADPWDQFTGLLDDLAARRLTGSAARAAWDQLARRLSGQERQWYARILNRDLKCGVDRKTVDVVWPGMIRPFGCQLAHELKADNDPLTRGPTAREPWTTWPVLVEPKLDGMRVIFDYRVVGTCQAFSREGHALPNIQVYADELAGHLSARNSKSCLIDCEAFAADWNDTISLVKKENVEQATRDRLSFHCFDAVCLTEEGLDSMSLIHRRERLARLLDGAPARFIRLDGVVVHAPEDLTLQFNAALDRGHEGVMVKFLGAPYRTKRSNAWLKIKPVASVDAVILDVEPGKPDTKNAGRLGAFLVKRLDTEAECRVGGGFTDAQRDEFWAQRAALIGQVVEFREQAARGSVGVASFPRFMRMRPDRTP